jgi:hypothetical protein
MRRERKEFVDKAFIVEPSKLTKLISVIHERFGGDGTFTDRFLVQKGESQKSEFKSLEDVLALDNSSRQRITRLTIHSESVTEGSRREIEVDFGLKLRNEAGNQKSSVTIEVAAESARWVDESLAEIEQQVERSLTSYLVPISSCIAVMVASVVILLLATPSSQSSQDVLKNLESTMWLTPAQIESYEKLLVAEGSLTPEVNRRLIEDQVRNTASVLRAQEQAKRASGTAGRASLWATLIVWAIGLLLINTCYPRALFLWGDEVGRASARDTRKKLLWSILLSGTIIPLFAKLYQSGLFGALASP